MDNGRWERFLDLVNSLMRDYETQLPPSDNCPSGALYIPRLEKNLQKPILHFGIVDWDGVMQVLNNGKARFTREEAKSLVGELLYEPCGYGFGVGFLVFISRYKFENQKFDVIEKSLKGRLSEKNVLHKIKSLKKMRDSAKHDEVRKILEKAIISMEVFHGETHCCPIAVKIAPVADL